MFVPRELQVDCASELEAGQTASAATVSSWAAEDPLAAATDPDELRPRRWAPLAARSQHVVEPPADKPAGVSFGTFLGMAS
jgi:hypothetical protein